ncbi:protein of unknown function [Candidatus Nitrosacidococcus tergens]|uniref:Uncharacterized protein n=1 Tax=Candidatus Nitrosacidococcus tergens TaxID=553981 RepID=A0A7G1QAC9_9GAMM|nr:protein of unknown function [Candidatus Nitrosacidococcus tergens]
MDVKQVAEELRESNLSITIFPAEFFQTGWTMV